MHIIYYVQKEREREREREKKKGRRVISSGHIIKVDRSMANAKLELFSRLFFLVYKSAHTLGQIYLISIK